MVALEGGWEGGREGGQINTGVVEPCKVWGLTLAAGSWWTAVFPCSLQPPRLSPPLQQQVPKFLKIVYQSNNYCFGLNYTPASTGIPVSLNQPLFTCMSVTFWGDLTVYYDCKRVDVAHVRMHTCTHAQTHAHTHTHTHTKGKWSETAAKWSRPPSP